jgi:hypothetical protein
VAVFLCVLSLQCDLKKERTNPLDPAGDTYVPPDATSLSGPSSGDTIATDSVSFEWEGGNERCEFRYRLDDGRWSEWGKSTSFRDIVDDGSHTFSLRIRYPGNPDTTEREIDFTVSTLSGSGFYIYPRKSTTINDSATVTIRTHGLTPVRALHVVFDGVSVVSATQLIDTTDNAITLRNGNTIDLGVGPSGTPIEGNRPVLRCVVVKDATVDTALVQIHCEARDTNNVSLDSLQLTGGVILNRYVSSP